MWKRPMSSVEGDMWWEDLMCLKRTITCWGEALISFIWGAFWIGLILYGAVMFLIEAFL